MRAQGRPPGVRVRPRLAVVGVVLAGGVLAGAVVAVALGAMAAPARADGLRFDRVTSAAFPTNLALAPDGRIFFTEKDSGSIRVIDRAGEVLDRPFATLPVDASVNEMGLLGLALHPDFPDRPWVYAYYSDPRDGRNHLVRIRADGDVGTQTQDLLTLLPTVNGYHNGGDLAFGADGDLYVAVGEGHDADRAQDPNDLGGKILRLDDRGGIPDDNPFGAEVAAYAIGVRNSFGLCVDHRSGALWATENGPSEWDELNRIEPGANYGWPDHLGPGGPDAFTPPVLAWRDVIVPTGCGVASDGSLYVGDYHGDLHRIAFPPSGAPRDTIVATFDGGITDVEIAPDGDLYVATDAGIFVGAGGANTGRRLSAAGVVVLVVLLALLLLSRRRLGR